MGTLKTLKASVVALLLVVNTVSAAEQSNDSAATEFEQWQAASDLNTTEGLEAFIYAHPDSAFVAAAEVQLAALQQAAKTRAMEEAIFAVSGNITFDTPLSFGSQAIIGKTLPEIIKSTPEFPPVAGLPEEYWKDKTCAACHQWSQANLCNQAKNYIDMSALKYTEKDHPFGGVLKVNLRNWAQNGCE